MCQLRRVRLLTLTAALGLAVTLHAQPQVPPNAPVPMLVRAFAEAVNSGDQQAMTAFARARVRLTQATAEEFGGALMRLFNDTGGIDVRMLRRMGPARVELTAAARKSGANVQITLTIDESPAPNIVGFSVEIGEPGAPDETGVAPPTPRPGMTDADLAEALKRYVGELAKKEAFSGVVLVTDGDTPVLLQAWGLASRRFDVPNRTDTRFNLGSINKVFTKTAILQLWNRGLVDLDAPISRYLPDYPKPNGDRITVAQLVEHRSGLGDIFVPAFQRASPAQFRRARDYFPLFANEPLKFEPGTSNAYSNAGYMVLGTIVEAVAKESYDDYVRKAIYEPAGMTRTAAIDADDPVENVAEGYTRQDGQWRSNTYTKLYRGSPAGGGYSIAEDLATFVAALRAGRLLPPTLAPLAIGPLPATMPARPAPDGPGPARLPAAALAGGAPGTNAELGVEGRYTIVVLSNLDPPAANRVGRAVRALIQGR